MTDSIVQATVRLSVDGPSGRIDVAVPLWSDIASLSQVYGDGVGDSDRFEFTTSTGKRLDPSVSVQQAGLRHGDVVVALPQPREGFEQTSWLDRRTLKTRTQPLVERTETPGFAPWIAGGAALVAAAMTASLDVGPARFACAALLAVIALAVPVVAERQRSQAVAWAAVGPAFAGSAAFAAVSLDRAGGTCLAAGACGLAIATAAAYARSMSTPLTARPLLVWMWSGISVAAIATAVLLLGAPVSALWSGLLVLSVVLARMLPALVIDVPDDVLIDFTRLAKTAWSAREEPRRRRRGLIRRDDVEDLAHGGHTLVASASVAIGVVSLAGALGLEFSAADTTPVIGAHLMTIAAGISFALGSRLFRSTWTRFIHRGTGAALLTTGVAALLLDLDSTRMPLIAIAAIVTGGLTAVAATALGRGWQSLWWGRLAEIADLLAVMTVIAALPLASGLFDYVRQLGF